MCSWFCETFCCFLLPWRDCCTRDTSTTARNQSKSTDWPTRIPTRIQPQRPPRPVNVRETAQTSNTSARIYGLESMQPKPKPRMSVPAKPGPLRINKPLPPLLPAINISRFDVSTPEDFQGLGRRPVESSKASTRVYPVDASPGDIGLFSPPPPAPPASSPLTPPPPQPRAPIRPQKSPEPPGRPSSQYQLFPTIRPTPVARPPPRKSLPRPPVPEPPPPSPRQEGTSDRTSRPVRDPLPGASPLALGLTFRDRRSASDFAAATAMMDLPPEFAPNIPDGDGLGERGGDVATPASSYLPPEFAPSLSGGDGLGERGVDVATPASLYLPPEFAPGIPNGDGWVEGDSNMATQASRESSESSSGGSDITTVYVGNRL